MNQTSFKSVLAETIKPGDLMRQADCGKTYTNFYHYRAVDVYVGDLATPVYFDDKYIGDRIERDAVKVEWLDIETGKKHTMLYDRRAVIEVAADPTVDETKLLTTEYHQVDN